MANITNRIYHLFVYVQDVGDNFFHPANPDNAQHQAAYEKFKNYIPKMFGHPTPEENKAHFEENYKISLKERRGTTGGWSNRTALIINVAGTVFVAFVGFQAVKAML